MTLRPYQSEAVDSVWDFLRRNPGRNPCIVIPTGGGKTHIIATLCRDAVQKWDGRVVVLSHVKELLQQTAGKLAATDPGLEVGVYSAGLRRRDLSQPVIVAGIQSIHKRACELCDAGPINIAIIDEAHLIPPDGEGRYREFLADLSVINPRLRVVGLTATPYRTTSGGLCGENEILHEICFEVGVRELIDQGFLCSLISKGMNSVADTSGIHVRGGEFVAHELENLLNESTLVKSAIDEVVEWSEHHRNVLIFAAGVDHGSTIKAELRGRGLDAEGVYGETPPRERAEILDRFRAGRLKFLVNCNVLTTGFDAPNIDCIAMLRPTMSPGLYYQMVGRGLRLLEGKPDCLVLDFGGNVRRHGPINRIQPPSRRKGGGDGTTEEGDGGPQVVTCSACSSIVERADGICPDCGAELPPPPIKHTATADTAPILGGESDIEELPVLKTSYRPHTKRGTLPGAQPQTLMVTYECPGYRFVSEWICFEHTGYAREKAEAWWRRRCSLPYPHDVGEAMHLARSSAFAETRGIRVETKAGEKYSRIKAYALGPVPEIGAEEIREADSMGLTIQEFFLHEAKEARQAAEVW